jgi:lysine-specific demethylase/histidyl-hydroxylase NO66
VALSHPQSRPGALSELVGDVDVFLSDHWDRWPLHRHTQILDRPLLSIAAVDDLITTSALTWPAQIRLAKAGDMIDPERFTTEFQLGDAPLRVAEPAAVVEQFLDGATIVLQGLKRVCPEVGSLCAELDASLTHATTAGAFLTPPGSQGFGRHFDEYDIIVIQVEGGKKWALYAPVVPLPLTGAPDHRPEPGPPELEVDMAPGDMLYLPRGWIHSASAGTSASLHITLTIANRRRLNVVEDVLRQLADEIDFRRSLPVGYARDPETLAHEVEQCLDDVRAWMTKLDMAALSRQLAHDFWATRTPSRRGQLIHALAVADVDDGTLIRGRGGANLRVIEDATTVTLLLGVRRLNIPIAFAPALRLVASGDCLLVGDLAPHLDDTLRLPFVRQLTREGYLEIVGQGASVDALQ